MESLLLGFVGSLPASVIALWGWRFCEKRAERFEQESRENRQRIRALENGGS